jgi:hypothetical protein
MMRVLIAALVMAAAAAPAAALAGPAAPEVPDAIAVTGPHKPYLIAHAEGVQIYTCASVPGGYAWRLLAPRATLTGEDGKGIGSHYAGPKWETRDGSVVAAARDAGTSVDSTAVDWLRLKATSTTEGRLEATTYIQRINTVGGRPPAADEDPCDLDTLAESREIPYSADYVFFKATGG